WGRGHARGWKDFSNLFEDGGSIFASARESQNTRITFLAGAEQVQILSRTAPDEDGICAWYAGGGAAWILRVKRGERRLFLRSAAGEETPAPKGKVLSGRITDISAQRAGVSWIAGVLGLARVAPPVWQPVGPPAVSDHRIPSIVETAEKELVFLGANTLWILSGGRWLERVLPLNARLDTGLSNRMVLLANSKIGIPVRPAGVPARVLVYDRRLDRFDTPAVPGHDNCTIVGARSNGRAWVACQDSEGRITLFSFDGT